MAKLVRKKLGFDIKTLAGTVQGRLGEVGTLTSDKHPNGLKYFELTNVETGEVNHFWLSGGLKGKFTMGQVKPGMYLEITHLGLKPFGQDEEGNETQVNDYDVFELVTA